MSRHRLPNWALSIMITPLHRTAQGGYQWRRKHGLQRSDNMLAAKAPKSIYDDLKRTKQWFFKWLRSYQSGDPHWYKSKSRAPLHRPFQIDETRRQQIISVREHLESERFAQFGVSAIKLELKKEGIEFPSDRTISRVLSSEGLVKKNCLYA